METKANYVLIGAFTVLTTVLLLLFGGGLVGGTGPTWLVVDVEDANADVGWASTDAEDA